MEGLARPSGIVRSEGGVAQGRSEGPPNGMAGKRAKSRPLAPRVGRGPPAMCSPAPKSNAAPGMQCGTPAERACTAAFPCEEGGP